jgi:hypothetical protein
MGEINFLICEYSEIVPKKFLTGQAKTLFFKKYHHEEGHHIVDSLIVE